MVATDELHHIHDRFRQALRELTFEGSPRERLIGAWVHSLLALQHHELPATVRGKFTGVRDAVLAATPGGHEARIGAAVAMLTSEEVGRYIDATIDLFDAISRAVALSDAGLDDKPGVPE